MSGTLITSITVAIVFVVVAFILFKMGDRD